MDKLKKIFRVAKILFVTLLTLITVSTNFVYAADTPVQTTIEGLSNYYITGESYASAIAFSGYNSRDDKLFLNMTFYTNKNVGETQIATFNYYVEIYDGSGVLIGTVGSEGSTKTATAAAGSKTAQVVNEAATMTSKLSAEFRTVVTVKSVNVAP